VVALALAPLGSLMGNMVFVQKNFTPWYSGSFSELGQQDME
jgi:hypothetical protein